VVHGPLNLINMLDYWRDHCSVDGGKVREISYRAVAPIYAGETYDISVQAHTAEEGSPLWAVLVQKEGRTCMTGEILGA
jgi:hydroxyacyl-ACP dehydratase HTD2-like protein with hotdog domain